MSNTFIRSGRLEKNDGVARGRVHVSRMFPILRPIFILLAVAVSGARGDLTILQEISSPGNAKSAMVTTTKFKPGKLRMDIPGSASLIMDGNKGEMVSLIHAQKVAIPMSSAIQKMAAQLAGKAGADATGPVELQPTGRKETMIGLACEEYTGTISGQKATVWITKDVPEYKEITEQFLSFAPQLSQYQGSIASNPALQGFPLLTELTAPDGKKTTIRVQAISREAISDADFKVPEGYRTMELPQIPGMPAGR